MTLDTSKSRDVGIEGNGIEKCLKQRNDLGHVQSRDVGIEGNGI